MTQMGGALSQSSFSLGVGESSVSCLPARSVKLEFNRKHVIIMSSTAVCYYRQSRSVHFHIFSYLQLPRQARQSNTHETMGAGEDKL